MISDFRHQHFLLFNIYCPVSYITYLLNLPIATTASAHVHPSWLSRLLLAVLWRQPCTTVGTLWTSVYHGRSCLRLPFRPCTTVGTLRTSVHHGRSCLRLSVSVRAPRSARSSRPCTTVAPACASAPATVYHGSPRAFFLFCSVRSAPDGSCLLFRVVHHDSPLSAQFLRRPPASRTFVPRSLGSF